MYMFFCVVYVVFHMFLNYFHQSVLYLQLHLKSSAGRWWITVYLFFFPQKFSFKVISLGLMKGMRRPWFHFQFYLYFLYIFLKFSFLFCKIRIMVMMMITSVRRPEEQVNSICISIHWVPVLDPHFWGNCLPSPCLAYSHLNGYNAWALTSHTWVTWTSLPTSGDWQRMPGHLAQEAL